MARLQLCFCHHFHQSRGCLLYLPCTPIYTLTSLHIMQQKSEYKMLTIYLACSHPLTILFLKSGWRGLLYSTWQVTYQGDKRCLPANMRLYISRIKAKILVRSWQIACTVGAIQTFPFTVSERDTLQALLTWKTQTKQLQSSQTVSKMATTNLVKCAFWSGKRIWRWLIKHNKWTVMKRSKKWVHHLIGPRLGVKSFSANLLHNRSAQKPFSLHPSELTYKVIWQRGIWYKWLCFVKCFKNLISLLTLYVRMTLANHRNESTSE